MNHHLETWHWPQYIWVILAVLRLMHASAYHGEERLERAGPHQGKPERHSFPMAIVAVGVSAFLLIAGGFFG